MKSETLTLVLVNLAGIVERADEALLPAVYKEVGAALHTDLIRLGSLTVFRSIVQCSCYPLAAFLAARHNRARVIATGAFLWAAATFLVAISTTFFQVAVARGLNGIGLAIVVPAIESLVADSTDDSNRGTAFGWLQLTSNLGSIIGGLFAILIASTSFMGVAGWRIAFHLVAIISVIVGLLVGLFANDPRFSNDDGRLSREQREDKSSFWVSWKELIREAKMVMKIPSFQVIVAQGVSGSFRGSSLSFTTMWLELIGFSHKSTAFLTTIHTIGGSLGSLLGGKMGDVIAIRLPNSGRIILGQISAAASIPLAAVLLLLLPDDPSTAFPHGLVLFIMGLCTSWNAPATNNPIIAEIVPERSRTTIYALDRSFETLLSSLAPSVVGVLAQHVFGYKPIPKGASGSVEAVETDRENAASLAKALYAAIAIPITISCFILSLLYCTYPRDRDRARMDALIASEMQQLEVDDPDGYVLKSRVMDNFEREFVGEESIIDLDDSEDKFLLPHQPDLSSSCH